MYALINFPRRGELSPQAYRFLVEEISGERQKSRISRLPDVMASLTALGIFCLCIGLATHSAHANFNWVAYSDGPSGQTCDATCGRQTAFGIPDNGFTWYACAVNSSDGTRIGTQFRLQGDLSCWTYGNSSAGPTGLRSTNWWCLCYDPGSIFVYTENGTGTESCADTCAAQGSNTTLSACSEPGVQPFCLDQRQGASVFGYQRANYSDQSCLLPQPPATSTANTVTTENLRSFQCVCTPNSTAEIDRNCSTVAYPSTSSPPAIAPAVVPASRSSGLSTGAKAGIGVGAGLGGLLILGAALWFFLSKRPKSLAFKTRSKSAGTDYWLDGDNPGNAFDTEAQFNTQSMDLLAFGKVHGQDSKKSGGFTDTGNTVTTQSMVTGSSARGMSSSEMPSTGDALDPLETTASLVNLVELAGDREVDAALLPVPTRGQSGTIDAHIARIMEPAPSNELSISGSQNIDDGLGSTWKIDPEDLHCRMKHGKPMVLGEGGYGKVYRGVLNKTDVAVKVVTSHDPDQQSKFIQEIVVLKACHNTHIVQFLGACIREQQTFMVMEYMDKGDLFSKIDSDPGGKFAWYSLGQRIAMDVCKGLSYLHSKRIAHLDLKSPNVLLTSNYTAKIGDVGLGKIISARQAAATRQGSLFWAAPEQLLGTACSTASDMFSYGTVLWEICTGERPLNRQTRPLRVPEEAPQEVEDVIIRCHSENPDNRPTADQVYDILRAAARKGPPS